MRETNTGEQAPPVCGHEFTAVFWKPKMLSLCVYAVSNNGDRYQSNCLLCKLIRNYLKTMVIDTV